MHWADWDPRYAYLTRSASVQHLYDTNASTCVMTTIKSYHEVPQNRSHLAERIPVRTFKKVCQLTLLLFAQITLAAVTHAGEAGSAETPGKKPYILGIPTFENEANLREWITNRLDASPVVSVDEGGRQVRVVLEPLGSGRIITTIYIFINERESGQWGIAAVWQTFTSEVKVLTRKRGKELVFKSKSGKILFRVPMETLEPKYDPDY